MLDRLASHLRLATGVASSIVANQVGVTPRPRVAYLLMTWKCNLRCVMCNIWKEERYPQLGTDDFRTLIRKIPFVDVFKIGGGEPFLRDDMPQLIREIQDVARPHHLMVITNGTLRDRTVEFARECGRPGLHLRVSLEGQGETHDGLRGRKGCFDKTMATLEALLPLKRAQGFTLGINYNITPETLQHLPWIRAFCKREGLNFIPGFWVYPFLEPGDPDESRALVDDPAGFRRMLDDLYEQTHGVSPLEAHLLKRTVSRIYDEALDPQADKSFACRAVRSILYVLPDGNVITCGIKHGVVGNLVRESFEDLWYGPKALAARREVDACPGCHQYALKIMSRAYTGESLGLPAPRRNGSPRPKQLRVIR